VANLKRVPTWLLVEELRIRKDVHYTRGNTSAVILVRNLEKPSKDKKEGNK
jgi:hypothetical protein